MRPPRQRGLLAYELQNGVSFVIPWVVYRPCSTAPSGSECCGAAATQGWAVLQVPSVRKQLSYPYPKRLRQSGDHFKRRVPLAPLDIAEIRRVHPGLLGELLLTQPRFDPKGANALAEGLTDSRSHDPNPSGPSPIGL